MGNYEELKAAVAAVIKTNGNQEITGQVMQNTLTTLISQVGANATFAGIATPNTTPGTPDQNVFYLASEPGVYTNFGGIELTDHVLIFINKYGNWVKQDSGIASIAKTTKLETETVASTLSEFITDTTNINIDVIKLGGIIDFGFLDSYTIDSSKDYFLKYCQKYNNTNILIRIVDGDGSIISEINKINIGSGVVEYMNDVFYIQLNLDIMPDNSGSVTDLGKTMPLNKVRKYFNLSEMSERITENEKGTSYTLSITDGYFFLPTGNIRNGGAKIGDYIYIDTPVDFKLPNLFNVPGQIAAACFYDEYKNYISSYNPSETTVELIPSSAFPENARYMRNTFKNVDINVKLPIINQSLSNKSDIEILQSDNKFEYIAYRGYTDNNGTPVESNQYDFFVIKGDFKKYHLYQVSVGQILKSYNNYPGTPIIDGIKIDGNKFVVLKDGINAITVLIIRDTYGELVNTSCKELKELELISCDGDSLTFGTTDSNASYPIVLRNSLLEQELAWVIQRGAIGDRTRRILARASVIPIFIGEEITLSNNDPINIKIVYADKSKCINGMGIQGLETIYLNGIECTLSAGSSMTDNVYSITPVTTIDDPITIKSMTPIILLGSKERRGIHILWAGTNDASTTTGPTEEKITELINYFKLYASVSGLDTKYIIMSSHCSTNDDYELKLSEAFGTKYLNVRQECINYGLSYLGITPTTGDTEDIDAGRCPRSLLVNYPTDIHFTTEGQKFIAHIVEDKIKNLGYL